MTRREHNAAGIARERMTALPFARTRRNQTRGFTLLELMIVITMIMILMSVAVPI